MKHQHDPHAELTAWANGRRSDSPNGEHMRDARHTQRSTEQWRIAPGDPTCVFVPGVAKPIACGSQERARLIAAAPELLHELRLLNVDENGEQKQNTPAARIIAKATER